MGKKGSICKQLNAIQMWFPQQMSLPQVLSRNDRYLLALLAEGYKDATNLAEFFEVDLEPSNPSSSSSTQTTSETSQVPCDLEMRNGIPEESNDEDNKRLTSILQILESTVRPLIGRGGMSTCLRKLEKTLTKMKVSTPSTIESVLATFGKELVPSVK